MERREFLRWMGLMMGQVWRGWGRGEPVGQEMILGLAVEGGGFRVPWVVEENERERVYLPIVR